MASGPQPAVEGSKPGATGPPPAPPPGPAAGPPPAARPVVPGRSGESGNGAHAARSTRAKSPNRSAALTRPLLRRQQAVPASKLQPPAGRVARPPRPASPRLARPPRRTHRQETGTRVAQGRRTRRVVRRIDVWTVLKMSFLFYLCVFLVFLIAGIVLWNIALAFNVIASVEKFIRSLFDLQQFTFNPTVALQSSALGGAILVLLGTGANVLAALLYNLISDVVGGVQFIVLEEAVPPPAPPVLPPE